jgi:hypothetical protein
MGAALTYARRYALFTLVGIAGEDDLDAPNLDAPTSRGSEPEKPQESGNGRLNGGHPPVQRGASGRRGKSSPDSARSILKPEASAELANRLLAEIKNIGAGDDAAIWAHRNLVAKNTLTAADAKRVEDVFQATLASFSAAITALGKPLTDEQTEQTPRGGRAKRRAANPSRVIDKSILTLSEPRRVRDRDHVRFVASQPCLICGRSPADAHHLRFTQRRALGRKVSDEFVVPLCRGHHRELHRHGDESAWWSKSGVDPTVLARTLWLEMHPVPQFAALEEATSFPALDTRSNHAQHDRPTSKRSTIYKTKPSAGAR